MRDKKYSFFEDVWQVVKLIPPGRVTNYGAIANYLGTKMSARMVGWAMNSCPPDVPAQRVVNRNGLLTGKHHFVGGKTMEELLAEEGVVVIEDKVQNFKELLWDPQELDNKMD